MNTIYEKRELPVREEYDVIVAGGGIGGIAAALSAKREGASVLLLEKSCMLGGLATIGLVNWYEPLCDGEGNVMTTGIAQELFELAIKYGYDNLDEGWKSDSYKTTPPKRRYSGFFNPFAFVLALNELMQNEGVKVMYDILASYPVMEGGAVQGVITESKSGREFYPCKAVIDATGDADLLCRAGVPCRDGENYLTYYGHGCTQKTMAKALKSKDMFDLNAGVFHIGADMNGRGQPEGVPTFHGISCEVVTDYVSTGQRLLLDKVKKMKENEQCLYTLPNMPQLRKTRCMVGDEIFLAEDGKHFENSLGTIGDFRKRGKRYEIPLGTLYNSDFENMLAAGRVISAEGEGWETARVIPTAALTGQAAGILAAAAIKKNMSAAKVEAEYVQERLEKYGVKIHF